MVFCGKEEENEKPKARRRRGSGAAPFKGVRMRKWGSWVSEIRVPRTRTRIWLGSYQTPEMAARAYDAALYCLRGPRGQFNFPGEKRPEFPGRFPPVLSKADIKAIAAMFSTSPLSSTLMSPSPSVSASAAEVSSALATSGEGGSGGHSIFPEAGILGSDDFWPESFLGPCMLEAKSIWEIIGLGEQ